MRILIVGIGAVGSVLAGCLVKEPEVTDVICGGRNLEKVKRLVDRLKSKKVSLRCIDASRPNDIVGAAKGVDVVVNTTNLPYEPFSSNILAEAFRSGAHYHDLGLRESPTTPWQDKWEIPGEILEQSDKWRDAGLTALMKAGVTQGLTCVLARNATDRLDHVDTIRVRQYYETISREPPSVWWDAGERRISLRTPMVYESGEWKTCPFGGEEEYAFPAPLGPRKVFSVDHGEVHSFPRLIGKGLKYVDVKFGPWPEMFRQMGFLSDKPIDVKGVKVAPLDVLTELAPPSPSLDEMESKIKAGIITDSCWSIAIEVKGKEAGIDVKCTSYSNVTLGQATKSVRGSTVITYGTAAAVATFTKMLITGEIKTKGIIECAQLSTEERKLFLSKLAEEKGIVTHEIMARCYK